MKTKKYVLDLTVVSAVHLHEKYVLLKLTHEDPLPEMLPGQFVEVRVDNSPSKTFMICKSEHNSHFSFFNFNSQYLTTILPSVFELTDSPLAAFILK